MSFQALPIPAGDRGAGRTLLVLSKRRISFNSKMKMAERGSRRMAMFFSFHTYSSNDGVKLLTYIERCSSGLNAKKALDQRLKKPPQSGLAPEAWQRWQAYRREGSPYSGEQGSGRSQSESFICWTVGSELHWIQSRSLKHALLSKRRLTLRGTDRSYDTRSSAIGQSPGNAG